MCRRSRRETTTRLDAQNPCERGKNQQTVRLFTSTTMAAALALHQSRTWLSAATRLPLLRISLAAAFVPAFLASPKPFTWAIPSLPSLLELFPPWLLAVPKKKTSHSRKAMRSANKGLKDKQSMCCPRIVACLELMLCLQTLFIARRAVQQSSHITSAQIATLS